MAITHLALCRTVVAAAAMNELTWQRVLEWEALHHDTCGDPKLLRFLGKPHDLRQADLPHSDHTNIIIVKCVHLWSWHISCWVVAPVSHVCYMSFPVLQGWLEPCFGSTLAPCTQRSQANIVAWR